MRFLVDAQLPPALARWFGDQGCSATAVRDVGLRESTTGAFETSLFREAGSSSPRMRNSSSVR
jgi:predicted nuclease of predicted toxin-antitoxin system